MVGEKRLNLNTLALRLNARVAVRRTDDGCDFRNRLDRFHFCACRCAKFTNLHWHGGKAGLAMICEGFQGQDGVEFRVQRLRRSKSTGQCDAGFQQRISVEVILRLRAYENYFHLLRREIEKRRDGNAVIFATVGIDNTADGESAEK